MEPLVVPNWNGLLDERLMKGLGLTGVSAGEMERYPVETSGRHPPNCKGAWLVIGLTS